MAQPLPYNRDHNFVLDEEGTVNSAALNAEFDNASLSINKIRENLAKLQNDDGSLRNGIVSLDSLSGEVVKDVAEATERAAQAAAITLDQALSESSRITQISESVTNSANSVALMKGSVDESEQNVTRLATHVDSYSDELILVSENIEGIRTIDENKDVIQALANDLQGYPIYAFFGGRVTEPNEPMNGVGGVLKVCADNIEAIKKVAASLEDASSLTNLADVVNEIGSTDYVQIDETGNTGA